MTNTSKISFNKGREEGLPEVFNAVEECCNELSIEFYIIGALAKEIWFSKENIATGGTRDVDFAIFINEEEKFQQLKSLLIENHGFSSFSGNAFVLFAPNEIQIDIVPFGKLEVQDGVTVKGEGLNKIKVNGFKEVYLESVKEVKVLEDKVYKVATLPGILLLKIIAFDDRPEQREKDPADILSIIENYFSLQRELIYEFHSDLFGEDDKSLPLIASRVLGREIRKPLSENPKLRERVIAILEGHISLGEKSKFVEVMALATLNTNDYPLIDECVIYLKEILTGINER